ncbi:MAG TPA: 3-dehydroquinate synthase [Candidatus Dormibacteraeota bacterium]|nr:3-dehydroquinate synthase [Candidatus Dormibacteraeota bacterium]
MAANPATLSDSVPEVTAVRRVALVGLPGSGKSAVGAALARRLGWRHLDTDELVERAAGRTVAEVFAGEGEEGFRERELAALVEALRGDEPLVLSCGGGLAVQPRAGSLLFESAWVVWLDAGDTVLLRRLGDAAGRPLLRDDPAAALRGLRAARAAAHARAHLRVDVDDWDVEGVVDAVVDALSGARLPREPAAVQEHPRMRTVRVELGRRSYQVAIGAGLIDAVVDAVPSSATRVAVVADRAVLEHGRALVSALRGSVRATLVPIAGGEQVKTWASAGRLVNRLASLGLDRGDCVVAVGGGTVGDLTGFAAATYQRGVAVVQVPSTLLAMVDSAIGGKTGVNLPGGKNLAGAFWQPRAVVCDVDLLGSVPERDWRAAFAEIVKCSMIAAAELRDVLDAQLDALLARDPAALIPVIARCCEVKAAVVSDDERESGRRAILNYGHTVGHALETVTGHGETLVHGEAVAAGMRVAGRLSVQRNGCPAADAAWQDGVLRRCGLGEVPPGIDAQRVVEATRADKKSRAGAVRWVLLDRLGSASFGHVVPEDAVLDALVEAARA